MKVLLAILILGALVTMGLLTLSHLYQERDDLDDTDINAN